MCKKKDNKNQNSNQGIWEVASFDKLKQALWWILLLLSGLGYVFLYAVMPHLCKPDSQWFHIVETLINAIFTGGVAGAVINTAQNMGVFKRELSDLIFSTGFLKQRADAGELWEKFTENIYAARYENLPPSLVKKLKDLYLPDDPKYVSDRLTITKITWADDGKTQIKRETTDVFNFIVNKEEEVEYCHSMSVNTSEGASHSSKYQCEYFVDDVPYEIISHAGTEKPMNYSEFHRNIKLQGKKKYRIKKEVTHQYSFIEDFTYAMKANYPLMDFTLEFSYPIDMQILFYNRGASSDFEIIKDEPGYLVAKSRGLILPKQGFIIAMKEKKQ